MGTYSDALQYLYSLQRFGVKLGLENIRRLLALMDNPHEKLRFIHIAGTNGKGSVAAMLAAIYRAAGYRTALYTSPHLVSFRERIQCNGEPIAEDALACLVHIIRSLAQQVEKETHAHPTFFEFTTAIAAAYFHQQRAEIVIWETGLGGRLDATNIVTPIASVITSIAADHIDTLGDTLEKIAAEKCGIIKPSVPVINAAEMLADFIAERAAAARSPLKEIAYVKHIRDTERISAEYIDETFSCQQIRLSGTQRDYGVLTLPLLGQHQRLNAATAVVTVEQCLQQLPVSSEQMRNGLAATDWPARFQFFPATDAHPDLLLDGAHNPDATFNLARSIKKHFSRRSRFIIFGALRDKDFATMSACLVPHAHEMFTVTVKNPRAATSAQLAQVCVGGLSGSTSTKKRVTDAGDLPTALVLAQKALARHPDAVFIITGSLFLVGEALAHLKIPVFGQIAKEEFAMSTQ